MGGEDSRGLLRVGDASQPFVPAFGPPRVPHGIFGTLGGSLATSISRALETRRLFLLLPFAVILGLICSAGFAPLAEPVVLASLGSAMLATMLFARSNFVIARWLALAAAFWAGLALLALHGVLFGTLMLSDASYGRFSARIDEVLTADADGVRAILSAIQPLDGGRTFAIRRARVLFPAGSAIAPGDEVQADIRFYPVPAPVLPNGFDGQFHSFFDGIGAYGNVTGEPEIAPYTGWSFTRVVDGLRRGIAERIDRHLEQPAAGIARAIINGDQSAVTEEARAVMATAGLAHVLSISGLHLTIVAGGVFWSLRLLLSRFSALARWVPIKAAAALGGIGAGLAYFAISGGNVAALRSTLMIVLVLGAVMVGRRALTMRNVAIAALVVIVLDPASIFRPSFQLSFAAVVALVGVYETVRSEGQRRSLFQQGRSYVIGLCSTSFIAGAATLLFSAFHFQQTSPLGVLGNLLAMPLVSLVAMPMAVLGVLAMPLGFEGPFIGGLGWAVECMIDVAGLVSGLSQGVDASPLLLPSALMIGLVALAWFAFFPDRWRFLGPALAVPAVLLFALDSPPDVLIADGTQALAVRGPGGLELMAGRPNSFAVEAWGQTYGGPVSIQGTSARCDAVACIAISPAGFKVALVFDPGGFAEECPTADLVVARRDVPVGCRQDAQVVDAAALRNGGMHWLRWDEARDAFEIRPAITDLNRPWRAAPR